MEGQDSAKVLTALVVEDNDLQRMIHRKILDKYGVKNDAAKNGKDAIDIHRIGQSFDLILMDWDMPIMNGVETTKKLRLMDVYSVIIGVSSRSTKVEEQEFLKAGADYYLVKPLNIDKLKSILDEKF